MTITIRTSRLTQQAGDQKLIDGLTKHSATITSLVIDGQSLKTADIITMLQSRLAARNAAQSTRAAWQNAVKADHDERVKSRVFASGLRQAVAVAFSGSIDLLADFGLVPRKKPVISPEKKAAAALKAKATRAARHTLGKKQKQAIKGAVPPTPPTSSPATATPPGVSAPPTVMSAAPPTAAPTAAPPPTAAPTAAPPPTAAPTAAVPQPLATAVTHPPQS